MKVTSLEFVGFRGCVGGIQPLASVRCVLCGDGDLTPGSPKLTVKLSQARAPSCHQLEPDVTADRCPSEQLLVSREYFNSIFKKAKHSSNYSMEKYTILSMPQLRLVVVSKLLRSVACKCCIFCPLHLHLLVAVGGRNRLNYSTEYATLITWHTQVLTS